MTEHLVVLQICFEEALISSEKNVKPAALSTASTKPGHKRRYPDSMKYKDLPGTTKFSKGASSGISAFGRTNAPVEISGICGVDGDDGLVVKTTLAKCVGTPMLGGLPITS